MAVVQSRTREEIRRTIASNLDQLPTGTANGSGSTTTLLDTTLLGGDDQYNGWWIVFTSGTNDGTIKRISDYTASSGTITWIGVVGASTSSSDTYELWEPHFPPERIHEIINDAIIQRTARGLVPDDTDITGDVPVGYRGQSEYTLPTDMVGVSRVMYRTGADQKQLYDLNTSDYVAKDSDVTISTTSEMTRFTSNSIKLVVAGTVSSSDILFTRTITSTDISRFTHVEFWIWVEAAVAASDLKLHLRNSAGGSNIDSINLPALSARTWTYCRLALVNPEDDTAIAGIALEYDANAKANTILMNKLIADVEDYSRWESLNQDSWYLRREERQLILYEDAVGVVNGKLLRFEGYKKPSLLSADSSTCEINADLISSRATARALMSLSRGNVTDPDDRRQNASWWEAMAARGEMQQPILRAGTRLVD